MNFKRTFKFNLTFYHVDPAGGRQERQMYWILTYRFTVMEQLLAVHK